jgi:hypothetical protein
MPSTARGGAFVADGNDARFAPAAASELAAECGCEAECEPVRQQQQQQHECHRCNRRVSENRVFP